MSLFRFVSALGLLACLFGSFSSAYAQTLAGPAKPSGADSSTYGMLPMLTADAEQGMVSAQMVLAGWYYNGKRVPKDYTIAAIWYRRAADQGDVFGQYLVGQLYERGQGVPKDFVLAYKWFNLAAAGGNEFAEERRDYLESKMSRDQIAEAQRLAREWKKTEK